MSKELDKRLHAYRDDLADVALKGKVKAKGYVPGLRYFVKVPCAEIHRAPDDKSGLDSTALFGESIKLFQKGAHWSWVQCERDGYVGYMRNCDIDIDKRFKFGKPTHRVITPRTFVYPKADMKLPHELVVSMGTPLEIVGQSEVRGTRYSLLRNGQAVIASHLSPIRVVKSDYVSVAETLLHTPYLWGGATAFGLDCSGIVQLSMLMAGRKVQRDSDMQAQSIGNELGFAAMDDGLQRGDLVFWKGHVGIMKDAETLIHANGHTMDVAIEPLENAIERIGYLYGFPTTLRRP